MAASGLLDIEDARRLVLDAATPLPAEPVELGHALGRVLGEDVSAAEPVPAFDSSAMDGFAVRAADLAGAGERTPVALSVIDESRAGAPARATLEHGQAIAISTGAMIPTGADAIVPVEDTRRLNGRVEVLSAASPGVHVRRAGDDMRAGQAVLGRGAPIGAAEAGVLASLGLTEVQCARRPRLSLLVSGDELLAPGAPARAGAIRDSNSLTLAALARGDGAQVASARTVPDEAEATAAALAAGAEGADVMVISGGVSVGVHDHVRPSLEALGACCVFWGLALKPGRPTWFGTLGSTLVFGLPGNPVSAMVTYLLLARPALRALLGIGFASRRATAVMACDYEKPAGRAHAVRCRLSVHEDGWHAEPTGAQGSHVLSSMLGADALAIVPTDSVGVRAGERVEIEPLQPWAGALA